MGALADLVHLVQDGDELIPFGAPVELGHAPLPDEGCEDLRKVVAGDDDGYALHPVPVPPLLADGDLIGRIANVHEGANHHLVVHLQGNVRFFPRCT